MKTRNNKRNKAIPALRGLAMISAILTPSFAHAIDWDGAPGTPGLFGDPANWDGDTVPFTDPASILNGGIAQIVDGDDFIVTNLSVGGNSGAGSLDISGGLINATVQVVIAGDDTPGTGTGSLTMSGGELVGGTSEMWFGSKGGAATITMTGGTISNQNWIIFGRDGGGIGNGTLSGSAKIEKSGDGNIAIGVNTGTTNTVTMSGESSMSSNNDFRVGWLNAATNGVLQMSDHATVETGGVFEIGREAATGSVTMSGDSMITAGNEFYVGHQSNGHGTLTMQDNAVVNVTNGFVVGRFGTTGDVFLNGAAQVNIGGRFVIGDGASSLPTVTVNGSATIESAQQTWVGLNDSPATLTVNGGLVRAHADSGDDSGAGIAFRGASGTINLNGGTIETPGFNKISGTAQINFNGGTIKATGVTTTGSFFNAFANGELVIQSGGLRFDTNGNDVTVLQDLGGAGGLVKLGLGTLFLEGANTYTGSTVIQGGTLSITTGFLADTSDVGLSTGSVFDLDFTGTDTINALFIDGVAQPLGTWGSPDSNADHKSSLFEGLGMIEVTSMVPEPSALALLGAAGAGLLILRRRKTVRRA